MTIFRNVFQQHLERRDMADMEEDLYEEDPHPADHLVPPPPELSVSELRHDEPLTAPEPSTSEGFGFAARLEEPSSFAGPATPAPMPEEDAHVTAPPDMGDQVEDELALRAAEAHRLIEESQGLQSGSPAHEAAPTLQSTPEQATPSSNRARTRLLGFGSAAPACIDPLNDLDESPKQAKFPCGWLVVIKGPGRGENFALHPGIAQIGRGSDQAISLNFGDRAISREQHAVVAYDPEQGKFYLGHGGKSNIIRLNDRPVLSTEEMAHGDTIRIGETVLRFAAFCDQSFGWDEGEV